MLGSCIYNIHVCSLKGLVGPVRRGRSGIYSGQSDDMVTGKQMNVGLPH